MPKYIVWAPALCIASAISFEKVSTLDDATHDMSSPSFFILFDISIALDFTRVKVSSRNSIDFLPYSSLKIDNSAITRSELCPRHFFPNCSEEEQKMQLKGHPLLVTMVPNFTPSALYLSMGRRSYDGMGISSTFFISSLGGLFIVFPFLKLKPFMALKSLPSSIALINSLNVISPSPLTMKSMLLHSSIVLSGRNVT